MNRQERRRKRLAALIAEAGSQVELAEHAGTPPNYLSQMLNGRSIGNEIAERLERAMKKPDGWMDQWLPDEGGWAANTRHPDWYLFDRFQEIHNSAMKKAIREQILAAAKPGPKTQRKTGSK